MRHSLSLYLVLGGLLSLTSAAGADTVHPSGLGITASYDLAATTITTADTLVISRSVVNSESFSLAGLYFSEHLPPQMTVTFSTVRINGTVVAVEDSIEPEGTVLSGYISHIWALGTPSGGTDLNPGDSLSLEIKVVCGTTGSYPLPLHTAVGYGNGDGFFAADSASTVTVTVPVDLTPPAAIGDLTVTQGR